MSRVVEPDAAQEFCRRHAAVWRSFCPFTQIEESQPRDVRDTASVPLVLGGLGLRSATHPQIAAALVTELRQSNIPSLQAASQYRAELTGKIGPCHRHGTPLHTASELH